MRTVLITGVSTGIGKSIAENFTSKGILCYRKCKERRRCYFFEKKV